MLKIWSCNSIGIEGIPHKFDNLEYIDKFGFDETLICKNSKELKVLLCRVV
jgi:hypothetical protein